MHLAVLVVGQRVLLQSVDHQLVADDNLLVAILRLDYKFENVEQLACVATAIAKHGAGFLQDDFPFLQLHIGLDGSVQQLQQVVLLQWLQHIELTAREQRAYHLERRILCRCPDERDDAFLNGTEERVLLRLAETMYLVDEEDGTGLPEEASLLCPLDNVAHVLDTTCHGAEGIERSLQPVSDNLCQRRLAHPGRSP